ncbi:MAG: hypothetical protein WCK34_16600 [Bacteroidota bacterium]
MKKIVLYCFICLLLNSCAIFGIHFSIHNPGKPAKYPQFSKETILLGELTPIRRNFDVTYYDLDIEIIPKEKRLSGWVEVKARALTEIDSIQLDLDKQFIIEDLRWGIRDGQQLTYSRLYRALFIKLPGKVNKGELFITHVKYCGVV